MMNHCRKCGCQLVDGVRFCANCGTPVDEFSPKAQETTPVFHTNENRAEGIGSEETTVLSQDNSPFGQPQSGAQQINIYVEQPQGQNQFSQPQEQASQSFNQYGQNQGQQYGQPQEQASQPFNQYGQPQEQASQPFNQYGQNQGQQFDQGQQYGQPQQFNQYGQNQGQQYGQPQQFNQYGQPQGQQFDQGQQFGQPQQFNQYGQNQGQQYGQNQWGPLQQPAKKSSGGKAALIVVLVLVVLGVLAGAAWMYFGGSIPFVTKEYEKPVSDFEEAVNKNDADKLLDAFPTDGMPEEYQDIIKETLTEEFDEYSDVDIKVNKATKLDDSELQSYADACVFSYYYDDFNITEGYRLDSTISFKDQDGKQTKDAEIIVGKLNDKWVILDFRD